MSYNPRIRNKRNNVIQVTGSVVSVTGAISAIGNISTPGTVTGSVGLFTCLTASIISASQVIAESLINPNYAIIAEGYITSSSGDAFFQVGAAFGPETAIQYNSSGYLTGTSTLIYNNSTSTISGVNAQFTSITGTLNGLATNVLIISGNTTLSVNNHVVLASASVSDITITLPLASSSPFRQYIIKKTDSNASKIIISGTSAQTIDGNLGRQIGTQYETLTIVNDGINQWFIL